jgi:hypothetical protein
VKKRTDRHEGEYHPASDKRANQASVNSHGHLRSRGKKLRCYRAHPTRIAARWIDERNDPRVANREARLSPPASDDLRSEKQDAERDGHVQGVGIVVRLARGQAVPASREI